MQTSSTSEGRLRRVGAGLDRATLGVAAIEAFKKLSPRHALRNPVMAIVLLGTLLTVAARRQACAPPARTWWHACGTMPETNGRFPQATCARAISSSYPRVN